MVIKLEKLGISTTSLVNSALFVFMGFLAFYLAPKAYFTDNQALFLTIINICFIIMLTGLVMLANLLQAPLQILFTKFWLNVVATKDQALEPIILSNYRSHQRKSRKLSLIYTLIFAFLIFIGTGIDLETNLIKNMIRTNVGADLTGRV